jgi:hypothetical protein
VTGAVLGLLLAAAAPGLQVFFDAASPDEKRARPALEELARSWQDGYTPLLVDLARFLPIPRRGTAGAEGGQPDLENDADDPLEGRFEGEVEVADSPRARARERLVRFLEKQTRQSFGHDLRRWRRWKWSRPEQPHPEYAAFKAALYGQVDPRFSTFFGAATPPAIRLDEVDWGGVPVNGIPPLDRPATVPAHAAAYLKDDHVVFGVALGGEARAYPRRILAWHELVRDTLGGTPLVLVYCPLCGTAIPYESTVAGRPLTFGTSGLLYRSNKLLFDEETKSLWSTLEGRPVMGPLAGATLELVARPVVTTTWKEWRSAHPATTVLSLETGHQRNYAEGAAYREYLSTDRLMFAVPQDDARLKNKAEVLGIRLRPLGTPPGTPRRALALSVDLLRRQPLHHVTLAGHRLVVVTTPRGANRVFAAGDVRFARILAPDLLEDASGRRWQLSEAALRLEGGGASPLPRVAAARAFWFGWRAQFPETELVR